MKIEKRRVDPQVAACTVRPICRAGSPCSRRADTQPTLTMSRWRSGRRSHQAGADLMRLRAAREMVPALARGTGSPPSSFGRSSEPSRFERDHEATSREPRGVLPARRRPVSAVIPARFPGGRAQALVDGVVAGVAGSRFRIDQRSASAKSCCNGSAMIRNGACSSSKMVLSERKPACRAGGSPRSADVAIVTDALRSRRARETPSRSRRQVHRARYDAVPTRCPSRSFCRGASSD